MGNLKGINITTSSIFFIRITIILLIIPIVDVIGLQMYLTVTGGNSDFVFKLIDYGLKIIDHIWAVPVVTGVVTFAHALVDKNHNGDSDEFEGENK